MRNMFDEITALVVPSFSSKDNLTFNYDGRIVFENMILLRNLNNYIANTYLISAYDIYYKHIIDEYDDIPFSKVLFIDSGGYETSNSFFDVEQTINKLNWTFDKLISVYDRIYNSPYNELTNLVFVNYDSNDEISKQLERAIELKTMYPAATIDCLLKLPKDKTDMVNEIEPYIQILKHFKLIGIIENELGVSIKDRLIAIMHFRELLNKSNCKSNIHIFGGMDPSISLLYFYAGANVFDGLSWQKIPYNGKAERNIYLDLGEEDNKILMCAENLAVLNDMQLNMLSLRDYIKKQIILKDNLGKTRCKVSEMLKLLEA